MTPEVYATDAQRFRAKAAAAVNDPELSAAYLAVAEALEALAGNVVRVLKEEPAAAADQASSERRPRAL